MSNIKNVRWLFPYVFLVVLYTSSTTNNIIVRAQQQQQQLQLDSSLEKCRQDLISSDTNITDEYLSLYEYEVFVNERYYRNCSERVIVSASIAQWEAFTLLACHSCLQESAIVDMIPDCCLPFNNSRISIQTINDANSSSSNNNNIIMFNVTQYDWLRRICRAADLAAVEDQCYTLPPTMAPTTITGDTNNSNNTVYLFANESECANAIIAVDGTTDSSNTSAIPTNNLTTTVVPDGYLSKIEFYHLLQSIATTRSSFTNFKNVSCTVTNDTTIIDAVYVNLVCASCAYTSNTRNIFNASTTAQLPDFNCCTSSNASISIIDIAAAATTTTTTTTTAAAIWLTRICTTITSMITCIEMTMATRAPMAPTLTPVITSNATNITTAAPMAVPTIASPSNATPTATIISPTVTTPTNTNISLAPAVVTPPMTTAPNNAISIPTSGYHDSDWATTSSFIIIITVTTAGISLLFL